MKLKPFGAGSMSYNNGYDLPLLLGHLEGLAAEEEFNSFKGQKAKRLKLVESAIQNLNEAMEMGNKD